MNSLWKDYFEEKGLVVVETDKGLMSAYILNNVIMIDNFYVKPEFRVSRVAIQLTNEMVRIAEERGCTDFCAEIYKSDPMFDYILRLHHHFGMTEIEDTEFKVVTSKKIGVLK